MSRPPSRPPSAGTDDRAEQLAWLREHCSRPPQSVLFDEPGGVLLDLPSAKTIPLDLAGLARVERRADRDTQAPYLLLIYGDGRQVALADVGVAFAPALQNSGPLAELPEVVCWRDFQLLEARLAHALHGHPEDPPTQQALTLLMSCIAILDGARAVGFDVSREERTLEAHLVELERRRTT